MAEAARSRETEQDIAAEMAALGAEARAAARALAASSAEGETPCAHGGGRGDPQRRGGNPGGERQGHGSRRGIRSERRPARPPRPRSRPGRVDGRRGRAGGRPRRPARPPAGRVGAAQRASHPPGLGADRRHRDHLRIAAQRDRRRRRALPDGGERGDPARRLRELALLARHRGVAAFGARRDRAAGRVHPARTDDRPGCGRYPAPHGRRPRPDRATRRPLADRAGAGGEPGAGNGAPGRQTAMSTCMPPPTQRRRATVTLQRQDAADRDLRCGGDPSRRCCSCGHAARDPRAAVRRRLRGAGRCARARRWTRESCR